MSLASIVRALGGDLYAGGRRANVPAPGHSPADRSVSLLLAGDRVIVHAFAGDDWRAVLTDLRVRGLVDGAGRLSGGSPAGPAAERPSRPERRAVAAGLWDTARPVAGTLAERHVRLRGVARPLSEALRHHSAAPLSVYAGAGPSRPALLAAIRDPDGALAGVEITYLAPNGERARLRLARKTVGCVPGGSAVRLDGPGRRLLVAEGVFSALSASERFGVPAWALLAAGNLAAWTPPQSVQDVLVAADRGRVGEAAAARLARRLRASGVACEVRLPPHPWEDWNDAARRPAASGGREKGGTRE